MKKLNTKLVLSALGIALLATPAFAKQPDRQPTQASQVEAQYPNSNGDQVSGSASNRYAITHGEYSTGSSN